MILHYYITMVMWQKEEITTIKTKRVLLEVLGGTLCLTVGMFSGSYVKGAVKAIRSESANYMEMSQSLEEAKKGLENTPQKTVFEYKISEELNEEEREDMIYEIAEIPE